MKTIISLLLILGFVFLPVGAVGEINPSVESQSFICRISYTKWLCNMIGGGTGSPGPAGAIGPVGPGNITTTFFYNFTGDNLTTISNITYFYSEMNQTPNLTAGPAGADGLNNMTAGPQGVQGIPGLDNMTAGLQGIPGLDNMTAGPLAGTDTQIIYNAGGSAAGDVNLTFNNISGTLTSQFFAGDGSQLTGIGATAATALTFTVKEGGVGALKKGEPVYISGASGINVLVLAGNNTQTTSSRVVGLIATSINKNGQGTVRRAGELTGVDTRTSNTILHPNASETWVAGELLFLTSTGGLTNIRPTSGRSVKVAYTLRGDHILDTLLVYPMENPVWSTAAIGENIVLRVGDSAGVNKVSIRNYTNTELASIDSKGVFTGNGSGLTSVISTTNLSAIYPINFVVITSNNVSPSTSLGWGTWNSLGTGYVLVGIP